MFRVLKSASRKFNVLMASMIVAALAFSMICKPSYAQGLDDYQFGTAEIWSTYNNEMLYDSYYYSDSWFSEDPETENDKLALISMQVTASAMSDEKDGEGAAFLKKLGFTDIGFYGFQSDDDDCAYMYGQKKVGDETVIAVIVQSYSTVDNVKLKGWKQNFTVNGDNAKGEHYALGKAADNVLGRIAALSKDADGSVRYWITGHSRGGALANLISAKLPAKLSNQGTNAKIYAYTFEAPSTVDNDSIDHSNKYEYIHNFRCSDDIVTMVPPEAWGNGMTLYGVIHKLNTDKTTENLNKELKKLGSNARLEEESSLGKDGAEKIIAKLVERIPERADYSKENSESFTTLDGQKKTIQYTHQGTFLKVMECLFGKDKIKTKGLADRLEDAVPALDAYTRAYLIECSKLEGSESDARAYYFDAAKKLCEFLKTANEKLPFNEEERYALIELAAPIIINKDLADQEEYAVTEETLTKEQAFAYVDPGLSTAEHAGELVFSHHFDTCIARLKTLAPQSDLDSIPFTISEPKAGDAVTKVTRDTEKVIDDLGTSWLDASAKWETDDSTLKKNKTYYLNLKLYVKGPTVSEDAKFTLNGKESLTEPKISYKDGVTNIRCTYQFTFGTPKEYKLTFETDHGEAPDEMTVAKGTLLKYVQQPVMKDTDGYRFGGWKSNYGVEWDTIEVSDESTELGEIIFAAYWVGSIDDIQVTFSTPAVGEKWKAPTLPKNANYHLEQVAVVNKTYDEVDKITKKEKLHFTFKVVPNSKKHALKIEDDEYTGKITVKGATLKSAYSDDEGTLNVECDFTPLDNNVTALQKDGSFEMADKVIKNTKSDKSLKGSSKSPLNLSAGKKTKTSIKLTWKKAKGAKTYVVYGALKGKKMTKIATVSKTSYTVKKAGSKLSKGKKYKFIVVARNGSKVVSTSQTVLAGTKK